MSTYAATLPLDVVVVAAQSQKTVRAAVTEPVLAPVEGKGCLYRACLVSLPQARLGSLSASQQRPFHWKCTSMEWEVAGVRNPPNALLLPRYVAEVVLREGIEGLVCRCASLREAQQSRQRNVRGGGSEDPKGDAMGPADDRKETY
ncbi:hypothetical protein CSAL01_01360 [Colletotrichum salicis]|uniref:Uncharacterized protein n=1 Tax=Colletotrichum salicis TaxID=1209931 RepID=A0A135V343_9PEZI|nr:hypothetical protein CSAL01_01360 [Colletotrichum salicis]